jgi:leader peptidase (prepilin peptidase)/N-methyltransferase
MIAESVVGATIGALVGATLGSAAGVALTRWPTGASTGRPRRSSCASCRRLLRPRDIIPIVSYLVLGGRCRMCGADIDPRLLVIEASCAAMGALVMLVGLTPDVAIVVGITGCAVILATATDLDRRIIPDRLTLPLAALVVPVVLAGELVRNEGPTATSSAVRTVVLAAIVLPAALHVMNALARRSGAGAIIGGGDVKLLVGMGAATAILPQGVVLMWAGALVSGGAVGCLGMLTGRLRMKDRVPFAPFLLIGFLVAVIAAHPRSPLDAGWS